MNTTVQFRVDSKTKKDASKIFESLGLDMSTGIKMFLSQVVRKKGLPFQVLTENGFTPEQEKRILASIKETEELYKAGKLKTFDSWDEMKKDILNSEE